MKFIVSRANYFDESPPNWPSKRWSSKGPYYVVELNTAQDFLDMAATEGHDLILSHVDIPGRMPHITIYDDYVE